MVKNAVHYQLWFWSVIQKITHLSTHTNKSSVTQTAHLFLRTVLFRHMNCLVSEKKLILLSLLHVSTILGARCSSMVRAFVHGAMGRWIDPSWWTH